MSDPAPRAEPDTGSVSLPSPLQGADDTGLRRVLREFASGVTVVTAAVAGTDHAMTATAFCPVSLQPPLVLVCVSRTARFHAAISAADGWAVSILAPGQSGVGQRFSTPGRDLARQFDGIDHRRGGATGAPLILGAAAWLECLTHATHDGGDHTIVVGEVVGVAVGSDPDAPAGPTGTWTDDGRGGAALTYHRGRYA